MISYRLRRTEMLVDIEEAANLLMKEKVVVIPTETVYGLAALADSERAINQVFKIKNRPQDHPLIVHVGSPKWLGNLVTSYPNYVDKLINEFWPGPLTIIFNKNERMSNLITGGHSTVAIRMPQHPICLDLLDKVGKPIVAPSANPYCRISPTNVKHVLKYFYNDVPILDGGSCDLGIESTIILACDENNIKILRPGLVAEEMIEFVAKVNCINQDSNIKFPGDKKHHYTPSIPLFQFKNSVEIKDYISDDKNNYVFILLSNLNSGRHDFRKMSHEPGEYSNSLYAVLHDLEEKKYDAIFIERPNDNRNWRGIIDRIDKASSFIQAV